ncbi:MAG: transporter substrate-binding domain-containing protein, partial [Synergistaceae bacterium]|nr:transporter substrate-binding domain-containing protein [Synergistaceae bacterium]
SPNNWEEDHQTDSNVPLVNVEGHYADGYDIQIAKIVAESIGAKLEVKKLPYQELISELNHREIDAIFSSMLDTKSRRKLIAFSDVYEIHPAEYCIMVHKDGKFANAKTLKDFIGANFIAQKDSTYDRAIAQIRGAIHLPAVTQVKEIIDKIINKDADATVLDLTAAQTYERVYPAFAIIRLDDEGGFKFDFTGICAGVRKNNARLLKEINDALKDISQRDRQKVMDQSISRNWEESL